MVPLLADRDLSARGVEVEFFGGRTRMPAGPALLALRTGAPLFVVSLWYDAGRRLRLRGRPAAGARPGRGPLDVAGPAAHPADRRPSGRRASPRTRQDWHMLQKLWLDAAGARGR